MSEALEKLQEPVQFHWKCPKCQVPLEGELTHVIKGGELQPEIDAFQRMFDEETAKHLRSHA